MSKVRQRRTVTRSPVTTLSDVKTKKETANEWCTLSARISCRPLSECVGKKVRFSSGKGGLEEFREQVSSSVIPEELPCRDQQFEIIYRFLSNNLNNRTSRTLYISGVPGTGKTATVLKVVRKLRDEIGNRGFQFVEVNGMRLTDPYQVYSEIYCQLLKGNKRLAASNALNKLNAFFTNGDLDKIPTVLLIDELDLLCTRRQNVLYQLFEWATKEEAVLAVLAIANTLDLPERLLNHRVSSRMGMSRLAFQPYNHKEIGEILNSRLKGSACVEEDAVELVSRKVAAVSGDLRKALEVCRRAIDIAMGKNLTHLSIAEVQEAMKQLANTARLDCVKFCSTHERAVLRAVVSEYGKSGNEEITLCDLFRSYSQCTPTLYSVEPLPYEEFAAVCARLSNSYLLVACPGISDWTKRFRLGLPADDINFSLNLSEQKD